LIEQILHDLVRAFFKKHFMRCEILNFMRNIKISIVICDSQSRDDLAIRVFYNTLYNRFMLLKRSSKVRATFTILLVTQFH